MFKKIALLALFLAVVFSACTVGTDGCTACNKDTDPKCTTCDETQFFFIKDGACVKLTGCKSASSGACTACDDTKFYIPKVADNFSECKLLTSCKTVTDQKCTACAEAVKATHSIQERECLITCKSDQKHNANKTACEADTEKVNGIVGCTAKADGADADTKCKTCKTGATLATSATKCVTDVQNCQTYNDTECEQCNTGFKKNTSTKACEVDAENVNGIVGCITKAEGADAATKCKACVDGKTLATSATKCVTDVKDCQTYNDTGCEQCKTGFKLNNTTKACDADKSSSSAIVSASLTVILAVFALAL